MSSTSLVSLRTNLPILDWILLVRVQFAPCEAAGLTAIGPAWRSVAACVGVLQNGVL